MIQKIIKMAIIMEMTNKIKIIINMKEMTL